MEENIPKGYQNTEVGIIPDDWDVRELGSISKVVRGGSPRPAGDPKFFGGIYIPWLTVAALTNIPESSIYVSETIGFLTEEGAKYSRTLENGTLIIANSGATLGVAKILAVKCCANDGIAAFIDLNKDADKLFLYYVLNAKTKEFREVVATGNGQPNLNTTLIGLTKISLPSTIEEQKAIAQSLSDVDALITECDRIITKKRNTKQGTMQQLLTGKKRLPGFSQDEDGVVIDKKIPECYKLTNVGEIPKDWAVDFIIKYCQEIFLGLTSKVDYVSHGGVPLIRATDIFNGKLSFQNALFISNQQHKQLTKYRKAKLGDVLVSKSGSLGVCALVNTEKEFSIYESIIVLQPIRNKLDSSFLLYLVRFQDTQKRLLGETVGSTVGHLNLNNFKQLEIPIPPLPEQKAIAQVLSDMDAEIEGLEQKRDKYKAIKQGMMQELLTGKTRLISSS